MFHKQFVFLSLPLFAFSVACDGAEDLVAEETSEDALTIIYDNCASGESANAYIDPRIGSVNQYTREASSINSSCRDTTIVDFGVSSGHVYEFSTTSSFPTAHSISECHDSYIHMRLLRKSGSSWVEESDTIVGADWDFDFLQSDFGDCVADRAELRNWLPLGTQYRVRARAYRHDGSYSRVVIRVE